MKISEKTKGGKKNQDKGNGKKAANPEHTGRGEKAGFVFGIILSGIAVYLLISFIAYIFWWKTDQSLTPDQVLSGPEIQVRNWSGKVGVMVSEFFISKGFGLAAFFIPLIFAGAGLKLLNLPGIRLWKLILKYALATVILSVLLGYIFGKANGVLVSGPGGAQGYFISQWLNALLGKPGAGILLFVISITYLVLVAGIHPDKFRTSFARIFTFKKPVKTVPPVPEAVEETVTDESGS